MKKLGIKIFFLVLLCVAFFCDTHALKKSKSFHEDQLLGKTGFQGSKIKLMSMDTMINILRPLLKILTYPNMQDNVFRAVAQEIDKFCLDFLTSTARTDFTIKVPSDITLKQDNLNLAFRIAIIRAGLTCVQVERLLNVCFDENNRDYGELDRAASFTWCVCGHYLKNMGRCVEEFKDLKWGSDKSIYKQNKYFE